MPTPDYIVVGSGINGLTCAALLGQKGRRVLVLERKKVAGGCMRTEAITAPGYLHDVMATTFVLFITSPAFARLAPDLTKHGLEICHIANPTGVVMPDGRSLILCMDRAANQAKLNAIHPGEGDRLRTDIGLVDRDAPFLFAMLGGALWTRDIAMLLFKEAWRRGPRGLAARLGEAFRSGRTWLETRYESELVRALFAPWVLHAGLGPENAFAGEIGRVIVFALEAAGAPIVKGGAGENRARAKDYRYGKGDMQIHYALKNPPRWKNPELGQVALLHLTPGLDGVSKAVNECERGMLPAVPTICLGQPHALDPSRCPPGAGILWIQLPEAPRLIKGDAAGEIAAPLDGRWTEAVRERYADRVEKIIASHNEGFAENVVARRAFSPADLEAMNVNLVAGDPYGGSCTIDQSFIWRPFSNTRNHETSIRGLYQIGASTHPGPGLSGGSGYALAESLG